MNRLRSAAAGVWSGLLQTGRVLAQQLSLVPLHLGHLLWLISQKFIDLTEQGYKGNAAVYACLRVLSISIPEPPLRPYTRESDGTPGEPLPYTHPLSQLIRRPNPLLTEYGFWELTTLQCGIVGRSIWWKERSELGDVIALWPLRPDRVGPIYARPEDDSPVIVGWSYLVPGSTQYLGIPAGDVAFFHCPDPGGESGGLVEGLGPLQVLASEVGADNEATKFVGSLVSNYATPGIVLQTQGQLSGEDEARMIKAGFMRDFGGRKRGQPAVIDKGTTIASVGFSLQQLEFPALRRTSESRIAGAFGVPAILAGLLVGLEAGIRATITEQRELFTETTCASYWRRFSDTFTNDVASEFGEEYVCEFDLTGVKALMAQNLAQADRIERAFEKGAAMVNEWRATLGLPELPDGNVRVLPRGATQVDENGQVTGPTAAQEEDVEKTLEGLRAVLPPPTPDLTPEDESLARELEMAR